jgi:hypothetical protein
MRNIDKTTAISIFNKIDSKTKLEILNSCWSIIVHREINSKRTRHLCNHYNVMDYLKTLIWKELND